jgi:hypothetical protein
MDMTYPRTTTAWSAVIFARNEAPTLGPCIRALARAAEDAQLQVTVLLNGTTDNSAEAALTALREARQPGRIFAIARGDKANAVNQFVHHLRPPAPAHVFVDAYAAVAPDALRHLYAALSAQPGALAAAALPSSGRSAEALRAAMLRNPGLHGSLFALRDSFLDRVVAQGLQLPLGLYRGDGLLGSFVMHDLDAAEGGWKTERLALVPEATWTAPSLQPWRVRDWRRQWRRLIQQARGRLQWAALREDIYPHGFSALPQDADARVLRWVAADPGRRTPRPWRDPFAALALAEMRRPSPTADLAPRLVAEWEG